MLEQRVFPIARALRLSEDVLVFEILPESFGGWTSTTPVVYSAALSSLLGRLAARPTEWIFNASETVFEHALLRPPSAFTERSQRASYRALPKSLCRREITQRLQVRRAANPRCQ